MVGFLQSVFSLPPFFLLCRIFLESTNTRYYVSLVFHEVSMISPAEFHELAVSLEFSFLIITANALMHTCLNRHIFLGLPCHHAEWKLNHKLITEPLNVGRALTLSHREQDFINSLRIVRGICRTIFTRHNYCQSGDCNQG